MIYNEPYICLFAHTFFALGFYYNFLLQWHQALFMNTKWWKTKMGDRIYIIQSYKVILKQLFRNVTNYKYIHLYIYPFVYILCFFIQMCNT